MRGQGGRGPYLADHVLDQACADSVVPLMAVAVGGIVPLIRRGREGWRVAPIRAAAVASVARRPPGSSEGGSRGTGPIAHVAPPAGDSGPRHLGAFARAAAPEVGLVQEEGIRELAEADEQSWDPGEQHEGLLVAPAQAPEEGQHRPVVVQQQEARGSSRRAAARVRAAAAGMQRGQRLDLCAAAGARASPEGHRGCRVPGRQGAVLLGRGRLPPGPAARRLAPPVYRHGPGPRRPQRGIERGGARRAPGAERAGPGDCSRRRRRRRRRGGPAAGERALRCPGASGGPHVTLRTPRPGRCGPARAPGRGRPSPQPPPLIGSAARAPAASPPLSAAARRPREEEEQPAPRPTRALAGGWRPCGPRSAGGRQRRVPRARDVFIGLRAPPGSRELGTQPAKLAALSGSASRPPSFSSSSLAPRPAPSPPAEVKVTAAPAAPRCCSRAPPPAAAAGDPREGAGETGHPGPPGRRIPANPRSLPGGAGEGSGRRAEQGRRAGGVPGGIA
jgi:hypothetical protein